MSESTMKALVYEGPREMIIRELTRPEPNEGDILIKVGKVGICGSEMSGYLGQNSLRVPPLVMGHEFAGQVAAVGAGVRNFAVGDKVTVNPLISCGGCPECQSGKQQLCPNRELIGAARSGAFAEYVIVPEKNTLSLPDHVSMDEGALTEPLACAVHVATLVHLTALDELLIVGAGPIGLFTLQTAHILGLKNVIVQDINPDRLDIVKALGGRGVSTIEELRQVAPERGFTVTVDAVGLDVTRQQCMEMTRPGGKVVFTGLHAHESTLPINMAIRNELSMYGSFAYTPLDFQIALEWISGGKVNLMPWIMKAPLEEGKACFEKLLANPKKVAKILLTVD